MIYVFDTSPFINIFRYYYLDGFPSLWKKFNSMISHQKIISVSDVKKELARRNDEAFQWSENNKSVFTAPTRLESSFVRVIFGVPHFQNLLNNQQLLNKHPVADPFVIAKARFMEDGCVVTEEKWKKGAAKIPNICEYFEIQCINFEGFMRNENWRF